MTINKYTGKTREEAIEKAKADLGPQVVIMNVKEIRPAGLFGVFRRSTFEVTGAIEDDLSEPYTYERRHEEEKRAKAPSSATSGNFSAVADEKIVIPPAGMDQDPAPSALSVCQSLKCTADAVKLAVFFYYIDSGKVSAEQQRDALGHAVGAGVFKA